MEIYLQTVFPFTKHFLYRQLIAYKHIICTLQQRTIQINICICIQTFKIQHSSLTLQLFFGQCKSCPILPILLLYPLYLFFIHPKERIDQFIIIHQILMYSSRYSSRQPLPLANLSKLPTFIQVDFLRSFIFCCVHKHWKNTEHHDRQ